MRKLLFFAAMLTGTVSMASTPPSSSAKLTQVKIQDPYLFTCTVTRTASYTDSFSDCMGGTITATATKNCTMSASTCEAANQQAYLCAESDAISMVLAFREASTCN